jgi:hypothetical protein
MLQGVAVWNMCGDVARCLTMMWIDLTMMNGAGNAWVWPSKAVINGHIIIFLVLEVYYYYGVDAQKSAMDK